MKELAEAAAQEGRPARDVVLFRGHPMVRSEHPTTIEVTTEGHLTSKGDCIIGVGASKGCAQLEPRVKEALRGKDAKVSIRIVVGGRSYGVTAAGDPRLELSHPHDIVIRKSDFISERTLAVHSDAAAKDIPKDMVRMLKDPAAVGRLEIEVVR